MKKILFIGAIAAAIAAGVVYWRNSGEEESTFLSSPVERGEIVAAINATGTTQPEELVDVGAQVAGRIMEFGRNPLDESRQIDYGTTVEVGTVLAKIDDSIYRTEVLKAEANLLRAQADVAQFEARLRQTEHDLERAKTLAPQGATSKKDLDAAVAARDTAIATVAVAKAVVAQARPSLDQAKINLGYCTIKSPVKGVIVDRRVNVGQTVVSSLNSPSLFLIAKDLKKMQVWASVNEADIGQVYSGQPVSFTVDTYPGETFRGVVAKDQPRLNASMTQNVVTYTVVVNTDNENLRLRPYLTANVQFEVTKRSNVLHVPNVALRWRPVPQQVAAEFRDEFAKSFAAQESSASRGGEKPIAGAADEPKPTKPVAENDASKAMSAVKAGGNAAPADERRLATLWIEADGFVRPARVRVGLSDGLRTEVGGDEIKEGDRVVTGEQRATSAKQGGSNPFVPQMFRREGRPQ